jgi:hypothetical protein
MSVSRGSIPLSIELSKSMYERRNHREGRSRPTAIKMACEVLIHTFPPPAPPLGLRVHSRSNSNLNLRWEMPLDWGGAALHSYEVEMRKYHGETPGEWEKLASVPSEHTSYTIFQKVHKCDVRVCAFNCATREPGGWGNVMHIWSTKELEHAEAKLDELLLSGDHPAAEDHAAHYGLHLPHAPHDRSSGERRSSTQKAQRPRPGTGKKRGSTTERGAEDDLAEGSQSHNMARAESGYAVVEEAALVVQTDLRHEMKGDAYMAEHGWSPFARKLGAFYVEVGVMDGCLGTLFDLSVHQVEGLVQTQEQVETLSGYDNCMSTSKPLLSLAVCACWVLQTLAHHTHHPNEWILVANAVAGMVRMVRHVPEDDETTPMIRAMLHSLLDVRHTLRQSDPEGLVTMHLRHKYDRATRRVLKEEFEERKLQLKDGVSAHTMSLVLHEHYRHMDAAMRERNERR